MEDGIGIGAAVILHILLAVALAMQMFFATDPFVPPPRVTVNLATEVSLESTAPEPVPESRAAIAPTLAEVPAPAAEDAPTVAEPERVTPPRPASRPATRPERRTPFPDTDRVRPDRQPERPRTQPREQPRTASTRPAGGSRIGEDFLSGQGESTRTDETRAPASQIGPAEIANIRQALARQVKPHWSAPSGIDVDKLVTLLDFDLNEDGSLKGRPRLRSQTGVNDSNRAQAAKHVENAIRAVQLAAPFNLPPQHYDAWKAIRGAKFDRNLSR